MDRLLEGMGIMDSWGGIWIAIALLYIFFLGDPDLSDALINYLLSSVR